MILRSNYEFLRFLSFSQAVLNTQRFGASCWVAESTKGSFNRSPLGNLHAILPRSRLVHRWTSILKAVDRDFVHRISFSIDSCNHLPIQASMWNLSLTDPNTSVLDLSGRSHDVDNLLGAASNSGVNPALTLIANARRVGDPLAERLN